VAAVLGAAALLVALLTPVVGLAVAEPESIATESELVEADPDGTAAKVRELPLLPVGTVARDQLGDTEAVGGAIVQLSVLLGLGEEIDDLLSTYQYADSSYPYAYPVSDAVMATSLDATVVQAEPDAVIELAGLLAVYATTVTDDPDRGPPPAATAYSLLSAARQVEESCDLDLTLLYVLTLGDRPSRLAVDAETDRATGQCGPDDDLTVALVRAQWASRHAGVVEHLAAIDTPPSEMRRIARGAWTGIQANDPGSPLGFAGLADLDARWADQAESVGAAPFQVLAWRREALAAYDAAMSLTDDPVLEVRRAEVQVDLGEEGEAVQGASVAVDALGDDLVARMGLSDVLASAGDHDAAADSVEKELGLVAPWWLGRGAVTSIDLYRDYAQRVVPQVLVVDASQDMYGGGFVSDFGFLPLSRTEFASPTCRREVRVRELMLAGRLSTAAAALATPPVSSAGLTTLCFGGSVDAYTHLLMPVIDVLGDSTDDPAAFDLAQDFLRGAGDLEGAHDVALSWIDMHPDDGLADQRLGEIYLLSGRAEQAGPELEAAIPLLTSAAAAYDASMASTEPNPVKDLSAAELQLGLALDQVGRQEEALAHYAAAIDALAPLLSASDGLPPEAGVYPGDLEMYAHSQAGALLADRDDRDDREAAIDEYRSAIATGTPFEPVQVWDLHGDTYEKEPVLGGSLTGAQANNLALLLSLDGQDDEAVEQGRAALDEDPASSVFTDTLAYAYQRAGNDQAAISAYRDVLRADPTAYVSANNLGVLLAEAGEPDRAVRWFRQAVAADPDYALAWHHLGSALAERWSPRSYVESQAAFAQAVRLDSSFRSVQPGYEMDSQVRDLDLDVSKPLDPDWQFATSVEEQGTPFTVVLLLLLLWRVLWSFGLDTVIGRGAEGALERGSRLSLLTAALPGWAAAVACVALLSGSLLWHGWDLPALLVVLAIVGLVAVPLALRVGTRHRSWLPAMLVGAAMAPLGAPYVPYPHLVASKSRPTRRTLLLPAILAAGALAAFVLESALVGTPVAHRLTAASAVLLASVLVPVPPLDGSRHHERVLGVVSAAALAGVTVALALGRV
jgi:tetratricopeptide (TPR) repeat protein